MSRVEQLINKIGKIGETKEGINRTAFSQKHKEALEILKQEMENLNLEVRIDSIGNIFGRKKGKKEDVIMIGSHLDTVVNGGLYDGLVGIVAGLECIKNLNEENRELENTIEIVGFNAEEGGPLGGTFGSRVITGTQKLDKNIEEKLKQINLTIKDIENSKINYPVKNYIELHIEQGNQLYSKNLEIGIVKGIVGITRYKISVKGKANHAGTTLMKERKDSLVIASEIILHINQEAKKETEPFVATVGKIENIPNSVNVIPGKTEIIIELRDMEKEKINNYMDKIKEKIYQIEEREQIKIDVEPYSDKNSVNLDHEMIQKIEKICKENNIKYQTMYSGAGHDAMEMAKITKSTLIFVPSKDGISHNKEEYTSIQDIEKGIDLIYNIIKQEV